MLNNVMAGKSSFVTKTEIYSVNADDTDIEYACVDEDDRHTRELLPIDAKIY
jgi:hypothetical protein